MRSLLRALLWTTTLSAVAFSGCNCDDEVVLVPGALEGRLCDPETRQGIPGAAVEVRGPSRKTVPTDGGGNYFVDGLLPGDYVVVGIVADGELPITRQGEVVVVAPDATSPVTDERCADLPPPPDSGTIDGQICDRHTGELVSDAVVEVIGADNSVLASASTDENGNFVIEDVPEGDHVVSIRAPNFSRSFPVTVVIGETVTLDLADGACEAPFGAGCTILGSMCDPRGTGAKLAGASVTVRAREGGATVRDLTDTNGEFYVSALVPGSYDVTVSHPDAGVNEVFSDVACLAGEEAVLVGPDACADRTPVGRVEGRVCILDPNESRGRFVGTVFLKRGATVVSQVQTDADGAFAFPPVPTGTYDLQLGDPALRLISPVIVNAFQTTFVEEESCPEPQDVCQDFTHNPDVLSDGRILFVVDRSGSMGLSVSGGSVGGGCSAAAPDCGVDATCDTTQNRCVQNKWSALKSGLSAVTGGLATTIQYGLFVYPNPNDDNAPIANCSAGAQRQAMGGNAAQINAALGAVTPRGGTPTASTMSAALPVIQALQADERPLAVVLATDGAPNCNNSQPRAGVTNCITQENGVVTCSCTCTSNAGTPPQSDASCALFNCLDTNAFSGSGAIAQIAALGVQTHVIGIPDANIPAGQLAIFNDALNQMAVAGGAPLAGAVRYHQATNLNALQASLEAVTRRIVACQITVPTPLDGATSIEVRLGNQPIPRDLSRRNGWDQTGPTSIQLFGSACDAATASQDSVTVKRCARP